MDGNTIFASIIINQVKIKLPLLSYKEHVDTPGKRGEILLRLQHACTLPVDARVGEREAAILRGKASKDTKNVCRSSLTDITASMSATGMLTPQNKPSRSVALPIMPAEVLGRERRITCKSCIVHHRCAIM